MAPKYGSDNSLSPEYASPPPYIEATTPETEDNGFYSSLEAPVPAPSMTMELDTDESSPKLPPAIPFSYSVKHLGERKNWFVLELRSTPYQYLHLGLNLCNLVSISKLHHLYLGLNLNISVSVSISTTRPQYQNSITFISVSIFATRFHLGLSQSYMFFF